MKLFLAASLMALVLAGPATAFGPQAHPSCKAKQHCKITYVKPRPWSYWTIVDVTDEYGHVTHRRARCHVNRKGRTWCVVSVF